MSDQKESHPNLAVSSAPDAIQAPTLSQSFLDSIPLCVLVVNPDLRIIQTNRRAPFFFEEPERMIGHYIWKICFNDYDVGTLRMYFNTHAEHPLQLVIKGREKSPVPVRIYASHHDGLILVFVEDRSELYLVEEELRNFRTAVQFAGDAIFLFDDKGMIFFTNPAFERQVGCSTEEIIGKNVHDFWTSQVPAIVFQSLWDHIKNGKTWAGELKCMQRGSGVLHVEVGIRPIFNDTHLLLAHVCVQRDITDRKRMERLLSEYSDNLQRLVDERTDALSKLHEISQLFHTTETLEKRLRLILIAVTAGETFGFNRAFLLLYNPYKDMLQGKIAIGPSTPEEAGRVWNKIQTLPNDGTIQGRLETYLYHANQIDEMANAIVKHLAVPMANADSILVKALELDRSFIVNQGQSVVQFDPAIMEDLGTDSFAVIPLVVRDAWIGVMVVDNVITREVITNEDVKMLDILATQAALAIAHANTMEELARKVKEIEFAYSELRHSQEQLIETSKFAALGQMAATVAHEIRTPLVAIGGFANMLKNKFAQKEDAKTTHYIEIISEEAMRLENVLNRLLFYARPSTPTLVRQDFNQFVESVIAFLQKEVQSAEITVETNFDPCLISVPFDRNLMRQVLVNLIQNGIQAMEKGGILSIETRSEGGEWFVCHIRDTGVGIPEEYLSRIYEPFFSTKHAGTGLGLHVSQRIIVSHGGSIRLDSQLGQGTTVTLRLPATEVPR